MLPLVASLLPDLWRTGKVDCTADCNLAADESAAAASLLHRRALLTEMKHLGGSAGGDMFNSAAPRETAWVPAPSVHATSLSADVTASPA